MSKIVIIIIVVIPCTMSIQAFPKDLNITIVYNNLPVSRNVIFPGHFKQRVCKMGAKYVEVRKPVEIMPDVYSTGELGTWIKE
jgi:hypothetical protein